MCVSSCHFLGRQYKEAVDGFLQAERERQRQGERERKEEREGERGIESVRERGSKREGARHSHTGGCGFDTPVSV